MSWKEDAEQKLKYGTSNVEEKFIKILTSVKLTQLDPNSVKSKFKIVNDYLLKLEDYERLAEIKKIEEQFLKDIKEK